MHKIEISKSLQEKIRKGYPWVFHYQILNETGKGEAGDLGVIYNAKNKFLAVGLYDPFSEVRLRILQTGVSRNVDASFFAERLQKALSRRASLEGEGTTGYRMIHGENDGFPGLVLDRYEDTAVLKLYSAAWLPYLERIIPLFQKTLPVQRCVLRLSRNTRAPVEENSSFREGQVLYGPPLTAPVRFRENGLLFEADVLKGQKTGFFLDQRDNRKHIRTLSKDKTVLNVFSYTGGFSVYAFAGGCRTVLEIDSSSQALETSRAILDLNFPGKLSGKMHFRQLKGDAFQLLKELESQREAFDLVILDPPAFAIKKKQKMKALAAYRRLAEAGARLTLNGGLLFSASCSAHVPPDEFFQEVFSGVDAAEKGYEETLRTGHAIDHPVSFKEGEYLKGIYLRISGKRGKGKA